MLEPEYYVNKADRMLEIYRQLEDFIYQDAADRLLESQAVSGTADRMIWKLKQMGESKTAIMNKLTVLTKLSKRELKELLQEAVLTSWDDDLSTFNQLGIEISHPLENEVVKAIMDAEYRKSLGELQNLTRTTMDQSAQDLIRMMDEAEIRVAAGVQSYSQAVCNILDNYAKKGIMINYPTGTQRTLEAAVRMCVVTSMNQTSAQITNQYIVEGNVEYVLVSAHLGARTQPQGQPYLAGHENWQGKVYKIRGSEQGYPNLAEMTGYDIDENGNGKVLNPLGLHGYNCRHSHKPWDKDLKNPYVDENGKPVIDWEESKKLYEKQQKQRAMERSIRKTKRELMMKQKQIDAVAETDIKDILQKDYDQLAGTLTKQNKAYQEFCEENDLQTQQDRLKVAGFKRAQSAKARGRARAYENGERRKAELETEGYELKMVVTSSENGIIGAKANSGEYVFFNEKNDYSIKLSDVSDEVNAALSKAAKDVAFLGTKDGNEHMFLVDLEGKLAPYYETNGLPNEVGHKFWKYAEKYSEKRFAFIHNHNTASSNSQTDLETPLYAENIPIHIAVTNDGVKYVARRVKMPPDKYIPDEYFAKELEELNRKSQAKEITPVERMVERERIIIESLIKEFYGGIEIIDGRK